ncbi:hypothetical protein D9M71_808480 [compost metagenome]
MSLVAMNAAIRGIACCWLDRVSALACVRVMVCDASAAGVVTLNITPRLRQSAISAGWGRDLLASGVIVKGSVHCGVAAVSLDRTEDGCGD